MRNNPSLLDRCWTWLVLGLVGEELDERNQVCGAGPSSPPPFPLLTHAASQSSPPALETLESSYGRAPNPLPNLSTPSLNVFSNSSTSPPNPVPRSTSPRTSPPPPSSQTTSSQLVTPRFLLALGRQAREGRGGGVWMRGVRGGLRGVEGGGRGMEEGFRVEC